LILKRGRQQLAARLEICYKDANYLTLIGAIDQADNCVTNVDAYSAWTLQDTSSGVPNALSLRSLVARRGFALSGLLLTLAGMGLLLHRQRYA
jgi:hypothetical protein